MEITGKIHCFFEQSGTFKNEFKKLGYDAEDYDIQDNFGQTDHVCDLFGEIEKAYTGGVSCFDTITCNDLIIAFFPCIYFCSNNTMMFDGTALIWKDKSELEKNRLILERSLKRQRFWELLLKLFSVCTMRGLRMIVENPYSTHHYLHNNFPYKPSVIDHNRQARGDYFKKPTQYWFHNCEPTYGKTEQEPKQKLKVKRLSGHVGGICSEERSMISPDYARNFICDFILGKKQNIGQLCLF